MSRANRDVQHADVRLLTILERVDPKTVGVDELPAVTAERRRERFEQRTGAVHQRRNTKNRRAEFESSNTKRGQAWRREVW